MASLPPPPLVQPASTPPPSPSPCPPPAAVAARSQSLALALLLPQAHLTSRLALWRRSLAPSPPTSWLGATTWSSALRLTVLATLQVLCLCLFQSLLYRLYPEASRVSNGLFIPQFSLLIPSLFPSLFRWAASHNLWHGLQCRLPLFQLHLIWQRLLPCYLCHPHLRLLHHRVLSGCIRRTGPPLLCRPQPQCFYLHSSAGSCIPHSHLQLQSICD